MTKTAPDCIMSEYIIIEPYYHLTPDAPEEEKKNPEEYMNNESWHSYRKELYSKYKKRIICGTDR